MILVLLRDRSFRTVLYKSTCRAPRAASLLLLSNRVELSSSLLRQTVRAPTMPPTRSKPTSQLLTYAFPA